VTKRVLHIVHWPKSGITNLLLNLLKEDSGRRFCYEIIFFIPDESEILKFQNAGIVVHDISERKTLLSRLIAIRNIVRQFKPHIVHTHSFQPGIFARLLCRGDYIIVSTIHSTYAYYENNTLYGFLKRTIDLASIRLSSTQVVFCSNAIQNIFQKYRHRLHSQGIVITNGIPTTAIKSSPETMEQLKKQLLLSVNGKIFLFLGRLEEEKNLSSLIKAFALVLKTRNDVFLVIVGDGAEKSSLQALVASLDVQNHVRFVGYMERVGDFFGMADVFVLPSRKEGLPITILESMLHEVPVVATQVGGIPEIIEDGVTGYLVKSPADVRDLAACMIRALNDDTRHMRKTGHERVIQNFSIARCRQEYENLYESLIR
jgi:glycosyltransferase involved in cell wall biosynthesis